MKARLIVALVLISLLVTAMIPVHAAEAASAAGSCRSWHVVKRGQNMYQISRYYGVSVTKIANANGIYNVNRIYKGQRLCIPKSGSSGSSSSGGTYYKCTKIHVVKRGEYVKIIAARYGVSVTSIVKANGLRNANRIYVGQRLKIPTKCKKPSPKPTPPPSSKPWRGEYFANRNLSGSPKFIRYVQAVDMNWGHGGPPDLGRTDNWSVRWTREKHLQGGRYLIHVKSKDGVRVLIDGQMVINKWHDVDYAANYHTERDLSYGTHTIQVQYYNHTGPARVHFQIEYIGDNGGGNGHGTGAWNAQYWNNRHLNGSPAWSTRYRDIVFNWGKGSPHANIASDYFSGRYEGDFHFSGGTYRFYATSDDGVRIWVDDNLVLDQWKIQARKTVTSDVDIGEGNHRVKVEYFENTGTAFLKVLWSKR